MLRGGFAGLALALALPGGGRAADPALHFRANQAGYRPDDPKRVIVFAEAPLKARFEVRDDAGRTMLRGRLPPALGPRWGRFGGHHELSLDALRRPGRYAVRIGRFAAFQGEAVYHDDVMDYSTNEPTRDGTASAGLLAALMAGQP
jgi:hypothetical protein